MARNIARIGPESYRSHPLATLFPLMEGDGYRALVADIAAHGLREPIVVHEGTILDGRNRRRACQELGIAPRAKAFHGGDPLAYVISANLQRRNLNVSQRAMIAARISNLALGSNQHALRVIDDTKEGGEFSPPSHVAAASVGVDRKTVTQARAVRERGTRELIAQVEQGAIAVSLAAKIAELPAEQQRAIAAQPERAPHAVKQQHRAGRERTLAAATEAASRALGARLYGVILADPPWRFEPYARASGLDRAADNHYPTMTTETIAALAVPAAPDCVLFLWATAPMLPEALEVMAAWGFAYRSHAIWVKGCIGTGYWWRSLHELLLVGVRGAVPAPAAGDQYVSVIDAPGGAHSAKPAAVAEIIEDLFPTVPRLAMFARAPRLGWDVWGNEIQQEGWPAGQDR